MGAQSYGPPERSAGPPDCRSSFTLAVFSLNYSLGSGCKNFSVSIVIKNTIGYIVSHLSELHGQETGGA